MMPKFPTYIFIDDSSLQRQSQENVVRSKMEIGPDKTRPIESTPMFQVQMSISMCDDKLADWKDFWRNDIGSGAYWFLMPDPFDGVVRRFRFTSGNPTWKKDGNLLVSGAVLEAYDEL